MLEVLPEGLSVDDIAFMFSFTTQTAESAWIAVRDGVYEMGAQKHIGEEFPPELGPFMPLKNPEHPNNEGTSPYIVYNEDWKGPLTFIAQQLLGVDITSAQGSSLLDCARLRRLSRDGQLRVAAAVRGRGRGRQSAQPRAAVLAAGPRSRACPGAQRVHPLLAGDAA